MEDHFGGVEVGETDIIQVAVVDFNYSLWEMKDTNYLMRMMDTGVRLLGYDTWKDTVRRWK